jgi:hypothetical protein
MFRSSETIGMIASALARAQAEIVNPEKLLVATLRAPNPWEADRTFRYAGLSSGLNIVRKSLGAQEIATVQTTAIDHDAGLIRLTTVLAHSSGEWLSSEWPVCSVAELAAPRRMGAALTYARRHALFTLVGIAGEDDLDAPDLEAFVKGDPGQGQGQMPTPAGGAPNGHDASVGASSAPYAARSKARPLRMARPILAEEPSRALRDRLTAELEALRSADEAALWAKEGLAAKNTLIIADAEIVEAAFRAKLASLNEQDAGAVDPEPQQEPPPNTSEPTDGELAGNASDSSEPVRRPVAAKPIRLRDKEHRKFVSRQPCLVCGRTPSDPHHLRFAQPSALGRKVSDEFTVPLCRLHHREVHRHGDEASWWTELKMDPMPLALALWRRRRAGVSAIAADGQLRFAEAPDPVAKAPR